VPTRIKNPHDALERYRVGYVSEDRKRDGLILGHSVSHNVGITIWDRIRSFLGFIAARREHDQGAHRANGLPILRSPKEPLVPERPKLRLGPDASDQRPSFMAGQAGAPHGGVETSPADDLATDLRAAHRLSGTTDYAQQVFGGGDALVYTKPALRTLSEHLSSQARPTPANRGRAYPHRLQDKLAGTDPTSGPILVVVQVVPGSSPVAHP
jgi:hypothetical protein